MTETQSQLVGAHLEPEQNGKAWLNWVSGTGSAPRTTSCKWLLAHCQDGVTWGKLRGEEWHLGSSEYPDLCPTITDQNLLELRLFGPDEELLLWRDDDSLRGRWLKEATDDERLETHSFAKPFAEDGMNARLLIGNQLVSSTNGFSRVKDDTGREQAVPVTSMREDFESRVGKHMPLRLELKHYFEICKDTGAVRVAASRLVTVCNCRLSLRERASSNAS